MGRSSVFPRVFPTFKSFGKSIPQRPAFFNRTPGETTVRMGAYKLLPILNDGIGLINPPEPSDFPERSGDHFSSVQAITSLGVQCKTLHSFSGVSMVMLLFRLRLVMVHALKPIL